MREMDFFANFSVFRPFLGQNTMRHFSKAVKSPDFSGINPFDHLHLIFINAV